jgi:hypothetical protein
MMTICGSAAPFWQKKMAFARLLSIYLSIHPRMTRIARTAEPVSFLTLAKTSAFVTGPSLLGPHGADFMLELQSRGKYKSERRKEPFLLLTLNLAPKASILALTAFWTISHGKASPVLNYTSLKMQRTPLWCTSS